MAEDTLGVTDPVEEFKTLHESELVFIYTLHHLYYLAWWQLLFCVGAERARVGMIDDRLQKFSIPMKEEFVKLLSKHLVMNDFSVIYKLILSLRTIGCFPKSRLIENCWAAILNGADQR